jgi:hypothetical protein
VQSGLVLAAGYHPGHSLPGINWTAATTVAMFALAAGKSPDRPGTGQPGAAHRRPGEMIDGILAVAVLAGLARNAARCWWWADPAAGYVLVYYAVRQVREIFFPPGAGLPGIGLASGT